ncbi:S1-C subfamily serine protease [Lewinella aquimaris]|uniref:S1-C subfamily serine protease n=1 Tax=Neolewinella aquimaris TaxID=1835722 RepID=A0A840EBV9_9BACT|nr:trypsin-like peptidase domain-containing protein [Neolewinella aquimaris]MBB4079289.1 S1-C subfamily serine protease [Neolewinella aquimaris]
MKNFLLSFLIVLAAFAAGRYFFPATEAPPKMIDVVSRSPAPNRAASATASANDDLVTIYTPEEERTIRLFERASPSVCFITTKAMRRSFWSYGEVESGSGSGFVWDRQGHVITNFHVINGANTSSIAVTLSNGKTYNARVVGFEKEKDLAVLKIDATAAELQPIEVGSSQNIRVGQAVYAIGNPFGLDQTLTTGIVSALDREIRSQAGVPIKGAIQTDAAINPGNSGGPLLDSGGQLIGVNTSIYSPSGASAGIGFSIPVDVVRYVVNDVIRYGEVRRPVLGADLRQYSRIEGLIVVTVDEGGGAAGAGLRGLSRDARGSVILGDVLVGINGNPVRSNSDLYLELEKYQPGEMVKLNIVRGDRRTALDTRLGSSVDR